MPPRMVRALVPIGWGRRRWPGLGEADLLDRRDLRSTTDLRAVLKGVLHDHLRVDAKALSDVVFPGSAGATPMAGLIA